MEKPESDIRKAGYNKLRTYLLFLLAAFTTAIVFIEIRVSYFLVLTGGMLLLLIFLITGVIVFLSKKYYNWSLFFLMFIVIAIVFRSQRWPGTGILFSLGFTGLGCFSVYASVIFLKRFRHITFLRYIGFSSSIILSVVSIGLLWKNMHWPLAGVLLNVGMVLFIPFLFAFVFTLPGSNYTNWAQSERIVFFRAVIIPMIFIYILCVLMFVFPDLWLSLTRLPRVPFDMHRLDLINKPGL